MKNLYFVSFYFDKRKKSSVNLDNYEGRLDIYLSNCCVALLSAKKNNPSIDLALVTNLTEINKKYVDVLAKEKIAIICCPFDTFVFPDDFKWSAAFYKLCALDFILRTKGDKYSNVMYTDSDVFCQGSFNPIFEETESGKILLYDLCESTTNSLYRKFLKEIDLFELNISFPVHFGGEFFASNMKNTHVFLEKCHELYQKVVDKKLSFDTGDEILISTSANLLPNVKNAGAFIYRFWTDSFRVTTTRYMFNPVTILHCPDQKERGLRRLFNYYAKHDSFPKTKRIHSILKVNKVSLKTKIIRLSSLFIKKYRITNYSE